MIDDNLIQIKINHINNLIYIFINKKNVFKSKKNLVTLNYDNTSKLR
jgi:hypothetical protein